MNILVIGSENVEKEILELCLKSKLLNKIYTATQNPLEGVANIEYSSFEELARKAKALQIDIVICADASLIKEGAVEVLRKNFVNVISVNRKWFNLETNRKAAQKLCEYYSLNLPKVIKAPTVFPIVVKTNVPKFKKVVFDMQELIEVREELAGEEIFLEEFLEGEEYNLLSLWDGKNLIQFGDKKELSEVQVFRLDYLKTRLAFMFYSEAPDFIGFYKTKLIWTKNEWYILEFVMRLDDLESLKSDGRDFLYILNAAIYQKLNEL